LEGTKHYINGGDAADFVLVMAVMDKAGISAFLIDRGTPGFSVSRIDTTMGSEAIKLAELSFENCVIPESALLGAPGRGFAMAMETLAEGRLSVAASCIGTADRLLELAIEHAVSRTTFGKALAERQAIQWMLADSEVDLATARCLTYEVLRQADSGGSIGTGPSIAKLYCSEMVGRIADRTVQIFGGMGVIRGVSVERFYRDVRHYRIGEGTSEIHRMVIAKQLISSSRRAR
jgi:alkylation response protein AidB-like acyl-CoA dehydrogenase